MTKTIELYIVGIVAALLLIGGYCWLQEHDARIKAEVTAKESQARVVTLEQDKVDIKKATAAKVVVIERKAAEVKTPAQAIAAIPDVSNLPLNARPLPDMPTAVAVDAASLYQELAACRISEAKLEGCTELRAKDAEVIKEKDVQVAALKHPRSFWKRVGQTAEILAIGAAVGYAAAHR